jgi:hypothetical protein
MPQAGRGLAKCDVVAVDLAGVTTDFANIAAVSLSSPQL